MWRWILAAAAIPVLSIAISGGVTHLQDRAGRQPYDPDAYERFRQIGLQYEQVSLVTLLANPARYESRKVFVSGFVMLDFEDSGLHLDRASYLAGLQVNAVRLSPPAWLNAKDRRRLNRRYAAVAGTFNAADLEKNGIYSGTLTELKSISPTWTMADHLQERQSAVRGALVQRLLSGCVLTTFGWTGLWICWLLTRRRA